MSEQSIAKPAESKPAQSKPAAQESKKGERRESPVYKFYSLSGDKVNRLRKECPRCGKGVFLGEHKDRMTCGKCGYTSFKKQQK